MAFIDFDNLMGKAKDLAQAGVNKSRQLGEIAKLNLANAGEEDSIRKAYIEIGKLYYAERGMAPEPEFASLCERVTAAKVNIEENKNRIEALKAEDGVADAEVEPIVDLPEEPAEPEAPAEPEVPGEPEAPESEDAPEIPPQE